MRQRNLFFSLAIALTAFCAPLAAATGSSKTIDPEHPGATLYPKSIHFAHEGIFGRFDKEAVQRGFQVYRQVCASCHGLEMLKFRNLGEKGGPYFMKSCPAGFPVSADCANPSENPLVKAFADEYGVVDGPDDSGDMFERPAIASDSFPDPYANEAIARLANNGALPPDLSLITKARKKGPQYVYSLLAGYQEVPAFYAETMNPSLHFNPYFSGWQIAMAAPLSDGLVDYADESTPETTEQYAADVVAFLHWVAEPKLETRKKAGVGVLVYLLFFSVVVYLSYRRIWKGVH